MSNSPHLFMNRSVMDAVLKAWAASNRVSVFPVEGNSMEPLIRSGDTVRVLHGAESIEVGDVLAYKISNRVIIHRLVGYRQDGEMLFAGDNLMALDSPLPVDKVIGKAISVTTPTGEFSLETRTARAAGKSIILLIPLRKVYGLRRLARCFNRLAAGMVRR